MNFKNHALLGYARNQTIVVFDMIPREMPLHFKFSMALWSAMLQAVHKQITITSIGIGFLTVREATKIQKH